MTEKESKLDYILGLINLITAYIGWLLITFMMLIVSCSVITRLIWNEPLSWVIEISCYIILYITFLGMAGLQWKKGHVIADVFISRINTRIRAILDTVTSFGGVVVAFVLTWKGIMVTIDYFNRKVVVMSILDTPQFVLMAIVPIGGALLLMVFILQAWRNSTIIRKKNSHLG